MPGSAPPATLGAVIFDWAGTLLDFGSLAPLAAFQGVFAQAGVPIDAEEARLPMGLPKRAHIEAIATQARVARAWRERHGREISPCEIDALYAAYTPINAAGVARHARLIPGARELVDALRARGLQIGSTTGYPRAIMDVLEPLARDQGLQVDTLVCTDDVPLGRPSAMAMYRCFLDLQLWPAWRAVKVDDTVPGLLEGQAAGCWTVAVTDTGNAVGLSESTWGALPEPARLALREVAGAELASARPDYCVGSVRELPAVLDDLATRLDRGERPRR